MKILLTADPEIPVPPILYGGVQRLVDTIIKVMKDRGHQVALVAHPASTSPANLFFPWPGEDSQRQWDTLRNTAYLSNAVKQFQPDVIHSFSRLWYMLPMMASTVPKIMTYGRDPAAHTVKWSARLGGSSLLFTGCSEHISRAGAAAGGRWETVYNFVELETYTFQPQVADDAPLFFLSRLERIKGVHTAIAAAKATRKRLVIAGNRVDSEEGQTYWRDEIEPHLNHPLIEYVGPVNDQQKNQWLGQSAAMIVPIEWEEPFGIVFAEALACGTPVISTPRGAVPEIIRQGVDGYFSADFEGICQGIRDLPKLNRAHCRQRVEEHFTASAVCDRYEELYRTMTGMAIAQAA